MSVWRAPSSGIAAIPPLPGQRLQDFHAVCYLSVDRWTTSCTVPGTERTHHQPGQSPVKQNNYQDSVFKQKQAKKPKKKKKQEKNSLQNLFFKEKAANSSSSEGLVGNGLHKDNVHFIDLQSEKGILSCFYIICVNIQLVCIYLLVVICFPLTEN